MAKQQRVTVLIPEKDMSIILAAAATFGEHKKSTAVRMLARKYAGAILKIDREGK